MSCLGITGRIAGRRRPTTERRAAKALLVFLTLAFDLPPFHAYLLLHWGLEVLMLGTMVNEGFFCYRVSSRQSNRVTARFRITVNEAVNDMHDGA